MAKEHIISRIEPILKRHGVKRAALFGSFARGEERSDSDVDILVELREGSTLLDLAGLQLELRETLGRNVDVVSYNAISPYRREYILNHQTPIL